MSPHRVLHRVGHAGKTSNPTDPGAVVKLRKGEIREVDCVFITARAAYDADKAAGAHAFLSSHMEYADCHNWAVRNGMNVYIAHHINAIDGKPAVGLGKFFYHPETSPGNGDRLAALMAEEMSRLGEQLLGEPYACKAIRSSPTDWTKNAYATIEKFGKDVRGIGICAEPFFITNPAHRRVFCRPSALTQIGQSYSRARLRWERGEQPDTWVGDRQPIA